MNTAINQWSPAVGSALVPTRVVVVGAGPVGVRFAEELKRRNFPCQLTLFGNEAYDPYNRVQLSQLLSREKDYEDIVTRLPTATDAFNFSYHQQHIQSIYPHQQQIVTRDGNTVDYDHLILATGSKPHIPEIEGVGLKGVFSFRNLHDTEALLARRFRARRIVVVGGGLLGLEAAKALAKFNTDIVLVQQSDRLMNRQLDEKASVLLTEFVTELGIRVITSSGVRQIVGDQRVEQVVTRDGTTIDCDTVLFCTGIKPATELAVEAGLHIGRGITVNDELKTSQPNIYAIGECCEHLGEVYGIVAPGFEQASVLADRLAGGQARYQGTQLVSTLKVVGQSVCSMGEVAEVTRRAKQSFLTFTNAKKGIYRKLVVNRGRLIGACAVGEWEESRRVQEAFTANTYLFPWQRLWFCLTGRLWFRNNDNQVKHWPEAAIICQCNQISRGVISEAINTGCQSVAAIGDKTSAGTVCGSCQPLLQNLLGSNAKPIAVQGAIPILILSFIGIVGALSFIFFPGVQPVESVQEKSFEFLWTDGFWKQVSGFSLVGIVLLGLMMSLRKRAGWKFLGNFASWRLVHIILGVVALAVLLVHTGAHLGENLNRWLMVNFLVISAVGALAGMTLSWAGKTSASAVQTLKKSWYWVHLLVVWPLPALLITHVLSVYFF